MSLNMNDLEMGSRWKHLGYLYPRIDVFSESLSTESMSKTSAFILIG